MGWRMGLGGCVKAESKLDASKVAGRSLRL